MENAHLPPPPPALTQLWEGVPLPLALFHGEGWLWALNAKALALLGAEALGRPAAMAMRQPALLAALDRLLAGAEEAELVQAQLTLLPPRHFRVTLSPLALPEGRAVLCAFEDLTAQEQIDQLRRDFVANVSHELRTPLTALTGFIETLQGPAREDPEAQARFLTIMAAEAGRMSRLVRDLLSLSRVEAQEHERPTQPQDVAALLRSALTTLRPQIEAAGLAVTFEAPPDLPRVPGDADQLLQVWQNLLENAVKYGAQGGSLALRLMLVPHEPVLRGPALSVAIADKGEGIAPEHLPRLTERFYRVDAHRSRAAGGTGLGLAIVKHIISRHGGRLRVESLQGQGSTFTVLLPVEAGPGPAGGQG